MAFSLKGDKLALGGSTLGTTELVMRKLQATQISANAEVTDINIRMRVYMHPLSAGTNPLFLRKIQNTSVAVNNPLGFSGLNGCFVVMKAV